MLVAVNGRSGEAVEKGVGKGLAHLRAEVAFLRAVRLVDHHDDVLPVIEALCHFAELEDRRDEYLALLCLEKLF